MIRIILIALLFPLFSFGQETKRVTDDESNEVYFVLKSDQMVRHGTYARYNSKRKALVKGKYKQGVKDSIWSFYHHTGDLKFQYDFTNNKVITFIPDEKEKGKKYRIDDGTDVFETELDSPPLYLEQDIFSFLGRNIRYPAEAREAGADGKVEIAFVVHPDGSTSDHTVYKSVGSGLDEEALRVIKMIPGKWIPGYYKGKPVKTVYVMPVVFRLE